MPHSSWKKKKNEKKTTLKIQHTYGYDLSKHKLCYASRSFNKKKKVVQELALFPFGVISYTDIKAIKHILCATAKP